MDLDLNEAGLRRIYFDPRVGRALKSSIKNPVNVPWPSKWEPKPKRLNPAPTTSAPLPKADVLVVTWTSGEARTMGQLFAGQQLEDWYEYRNNVASFLPIVTGSQAPFNDSSSYNSRYYHVLGLYCMVDVDGISVLVLKSGLHPAYDGPDVPVVELWKQLIAQVAPKLLITTGTGGGIGSDVKLGDVNIASGARFDCTGQFKDKPWAHAEYACSSLNESAIEALATPDLLKPNGDHLITPGIPRLIFGSDIVTTDTFAFDDSTDFFHLQGLGKCCDMEDATLGLALSQMSGELPQWVSIRNASDPQIQNTDGNLKKAKQDAENIYEDYQEVTTAGSVVATWATIVATLGAP
jgi:nucleoside phosphorylase